MLLEDVDRRRCGCSGRDEGGQEDGCFALLAVCDPCRGGVRMKRVTDFNVCGKGISKGGAASFTGA